MGFKVGTQVQAKRGNWWNIAGVRASAHWAFGGIVSDNLRLHARMTAAASAPPFVGGRAMSSVTVREEAARRSAIPMPRLGREAMVTIGVTATIVCLTAALLATQVDVKNQRLVALTAVMAAVWAGALRWSWGFARPHRLASPFVALVGSLAGLAGVSLVNFWLFGTVVPATVLLVTAASVFGLAWVSHEIAHSSFRPRSRVAFVGTDPDCLDAIRVLQDEKRNEFECVGVVGDLPVGSSPGNVASLGGEADLAAVVRRLRPEFVVCASGRRESVFDRLLDEGITTVSVIDTLDLQEKAFRRVASTSVPPSWFAGVIDTSQQRYSAPAKRAFDVTMSLAALVLAAPFFALVPLAIRCCGRGPVLYRQTRTGEGGRPFQMLKFRTMIPNAETDGAVWAAEHDPRITPIGHVLRRTRLDELPQLWNVLRGEMSIVGPRPERPEFLSVLSDNLPCWNRRHLVKPGITGWAQVQYTYTADVSGAATKLSYDLYYLKYRSLSFDLLILLKTVGVVLLRTGAR